MKLQQPDMNNPFWEFSLALYSKPQVEETAIALQDAIGVNVNLLLWACWLETEKKAIDTGALEDAQRAIASLHKDFVIPLRALRKSPHLDLQTEMTRQLKKAIQDAEMVAEQVIVSALFAHSERIQYKPLKEIDGSNVCKYLLMVNPDMDADTCAAPFVKAMTSPSDEDDE